MMSRRTDTKAALDALEAKLDALCHLPYREWQALDCEAEALIEELERMDEEEFV